MFTIENREDLESLSKLVSIHIHVKALRLQDKSGKQTFHEDMENVFELVTNTIKGASQDVTNNVKESSEENDIALGKLNDIFLRNNE